MDGRTARVAAGVRRTSSSVSTMTTDHEMYGEMECGQHRNSRLSAEETYHEREDTLLVFSAVPGSKDDGSLLFHIEDNGGLAVQIMADPVLIYLRAAVDDGKVWLKSVELFGFLWTNEHVLWWRIESERCERVSCCCLPQGPSPWSFAYRNKVLLPGQLVDKANLSTRVGAGTTIEIRHVELIDSIHVSHRLVVEFLKDFRARRLVDFVPVNMVCRLGTRIQDNKTIMGRPTRVLARVHGKGISVLGLGHNAFLVGLFMQVQFRVGEIAIDGRRVSDTVNV
jgi:hypothetical protein